MAARLRLYTERAGNALTLPDYLANRFEDHSNVLRIVTAVVIDHGHVGGFGGNGFAGGHDLGHLVHGGAHVQAVLRGRHVQPAVGGVPVEQCGIEEGSHGAEDHHGGHGHGHVFGAALDRSG